MVYELLADSKKHSEVTGHKAHIGKKVGDPFSVFGGSIKGINVDLVPGRRIVQAWRNSEFPEGIFSMATFSFSPTKDGGTELVLTHRGVPKELIPKTEKRWKEAYWDKMKTAIRLSDR